MNRTPSVPKSALLELDKGQYFYPETSFLSTEGSLVTFGDYIAPKIITEISSYLIIK